MRRAGGYDPKLGPKHPDNFDPTLEPIRAPRRRRIEKGTLYVNGSCLGPAERDPSTGNTELGPHITARAAKAGDIAVVRVDRSPMNPRRWELTLACGHTLWVTSGKRPSRKTSKCATCAR